MRSPFALLLVLASSFTAAAQQPAQPPPSPETFDLAPGQPAPIPGHVEAYADDNGLSTDEAARRLALQPSVGDLEARLLQEYPDQYAGLYVLHGPVFRGIVQFTDPVADGAGLAADGPLNGIIEVTTVALPLSALREAQRRATQAARTLGLLVESGINIVENRVELYSVNVAALRAAVAAGQLALPQGVEILGVPSLSTPLGAVASAVSGGAPGDPIYGGLYTTHPNGLGPSATRGACTTGFSTLTSSATRGIATAGHCGYRGMAADFYGSSLPWQNEQESGSHDLQWHTIPNLTSRGLVWDGSAHLPVRGQRSRTSQFVNEYVCKYGITTRLTCGYITDKYYDKYGQDSITSNDEFGDNTWVRVRKSGSGAMGDSGDSGGTVFTTGGYPSYPYSTAYGIVSAKITSGSVVDMLYMPVNFISIFGLSLVTE